MQKKWLFIFSIFLPVILFAGDDTQTDIIPRTVNFLIFVAILYYLLADQLKQFFTGRTKSIQNQLDEVQKKLDESKKRMEFAKAELEASKNIANELVKDSMVDVNSIKSKVSKLYENEMSTLLKNFNAKIELETRKVKKEVVSEILNELLSDENVVMTESNLQSIILKKVA